MKATIVVQMDNAAFGDDPNAELARILRDLAEQVGSDAIADDHTIRDVNGNAVGRIRFTD